MGQGETVLPKVLTGGDSSVDCPKVQASEGQCFERSHKGYITYYNFEAVSVKCQFPLYMTSVGSRGTALTWKVKDKALASWQEVMQDLQSVA